MTATITAVIAEDDIYNREFLKQILSKENINVIGEAANGYELIELSKLNPMIIFADIEMPDMDGLTAVEKINGSYNNRPMIVFITGHAEYAVDAFDLCGFDYILKPFKPERVRKTLERVRNNISINSGNLNEIPKSSMISDKICIKVSNGLQFIGLENIIYIEKEGKKTIIHTDDNRFETNETINNLQKRLESSFFFRSHKCFLVNLKKIDKIIPWGKHSHLIRFTNSKTEVLISLNKLQELQRLISD